MYEKLNKKARGLMLVGDIFGAIILSIIIVAIWMAAIRTNFDNKFDVYFIIVLVVIWAISIVAPFIRYELYRYRITDEEIDVKEGLIFIERRVVPIERLHKVSMISGPFDRMFGLSKVIVTTAGGDVVIRFLETEKAEAIVESLKTRINSYAIAQRG